MSTVNIMRACRLAATVSAAVLCTTVAGMSEVIPLAGGKSIEGEVIRTNDTSITIRTRTGIQTYQFYELANPPIDIRLDTSPRTIPTGRPSVSQTGATPSAVATSPLPDSHGDLDAHTGRSIAALLLSVRTGQVLFFLGWLLLVIQGFRVSIRWGVLNLLFSLLSGLLFLVFHPKQAILPFIIMLVGIVVFAMSPFWALWLFLK